MIKRYGVHLLLMNVDEALLNPDPDVQKAGKP